MSTPAEPPEDETERANRQEAAGRTSFDILIELGEALTAVTNYVQAASRLVTVGQSTQQKLREAHEKSLAQLSRADDLFRRLRERLGNENSAKK